MTSYIKLRKKPFLSQAAVVHTFSQALGRQKQTDGISEVKANLVSSEFQDSQDYTEKPSFRGPLKMEKKQNHSSTYLTDNNSGFGHKATAVKTRLHSFLSACHYNVIWELERALSSNPMLCKHKVPG